MNKMPVFTVEIKLPAILYDFEASYSHVDKLSGIQYMILTILSTDSFRELTWDKVMERFGIPEIIYSEIYKPTIEEMSSVKMIEPATNTELEDYVNKTILTNIGMQAYNKGVLAQNPENFKGTVANIPAAPENKYVKESSIALCNNDGFVESAFSDLESDELKIENHIIKEKSKYGVDESDADIFDIRIEKQKELKCYKKDLYLSLDEITGHFVIKNKDIDENFLKAKYTSTEILSKIPDILSQPSSPDVKCNVWADHSPDWEKISFILPFDIKFNKSKLVLVNGTTCTSSVYSNFKIDSEADLATIETSNVGYEYVFVNIPSSIEGFEDKVNCKLAVRHKINEKRIAEYVESTARNICPTDTNSLDKALNICEIIDNKELIKEICRIYLHKTTNFQTALNELQTYKNKKWYSVIPDIVEEILVEKETNAKQISLILHQTDIRIAGTLVASKFKSDDPSTSLSNADALAPVVNNEITLLQNMNLEQIITDKILHESSAPYKSKYLASMSNLSRNLHELKQIFNITSLSEYTFDLSNMNEEKKERLKSLLPTYEKDMKSISNIIRNTDGYSELKLYESFFEELYQFIKPDNKSDLRKFGIEEGIRLTEALKKIGLEGTLDEMITKANEKKIISNSDYANLTEFRKFRNECAHRMTVREVKDNELKKWKETIDNLSNENKKENE